jgi:hypothetical protein
MAIARPSGQLRRSPPKRAAASAHSREACDAGYLAGITRTREGTLKQTDEGPKESQPAGVLAVLVIGISLNTLGVVLVALRGIGWAGFGLMVAGMAMLLFAVVRLAAEARRNRADEPRER